VQVLVKLLPLVIGRLDSGGAPVQKKVIHVAQPSRPSPACSF
jgi:hypothetical protein